MNKETIIKTLALLKSAYPNSLNNQTSIESKQMVELWFNFFKDEEPKIFENAAKNIMGRSDFFPSIAQIKKEITLLKTPMLNDSADSEWEKVIELIRSYKGQHDHLNSLNPITKSIIETFNFSNLCDMTSEELKWKRRDFIDLYEKQKD